MNNSHNLHRLVRKNVANLAPYRSARDEFDKARDGLIFLDANENPFETKVNRYPDPQQRELKSVLAQMNGLPSNRILLGNGSDEVLDLLFRAFCEPKEDHVITLPPTYGMYKVLAGINNVENKEIQLLEDFQPNTSEIFRSQNENSKLLFLCSPNNPTGTSISEENMRLLLEEFNGLVVVDEAYIDFSETDSWSKHLEEYPNLVIVQTLSKAYGMAGIRLGICFASAEIISVLNKIKPPYNVNRLTQDAALLRLQNKNIIEEEIALLLTEKSILIKELLQLEVVEEVFPSNTNFLLVRVDNAAKRYEQLLGHGIVVRNRSSQHLCGNTLRFTVGAPEENKRLIAALKTYSA